jgi:2-dehydro-3-deoxyglucarate aldolase
MNRKKFIKKIRKKLKNNKKASIGSWIQIPHPSIAEIMGAAGFDWVAVDMEHGSISHHQLPDLFRSLELGNTLPFARVAKACPLLCKQALDAGAAGLILPMIENAEQLLTIKNSCFWPPKGSRGVGFSRANLFGKNFKNYSIEAQSPFIVAMIETIEALKNIQEILSVEGLDAIMIGPYDLSASMNITGKFNNIKFRSVIKKILREAKEAKIPAGIHIIEPSIKQLNTRIREGYKFLAYSIDGVMLRNACEIFKKNI